MLNHTKRKNVVFLWSSFNKDAQRDGVNVNATKPEITIEITIVMANCLYISPLNPPIKATGINTAERTKTIATIAPETSFIALNDASLGDIPSLICLSTFSITIIASSTTIPIARTKPKSVSKLILNPKAYIPANAPIIDTGTAKIGIKVALQFCKNKNIIKITNKIASTNVFATSFIEISTNCVLS